MFNDNDKFYDDLVARMRYIAIYWLIKYYQQSHFYQFQNVDQINSLDKLIVKLENIHI